MRVLNRLVAVAFVLCILLQLNDPDPGLWMFTYSVPLLGCILWEKGSLGRIQSGVVSILALLAACFLVRSIPASASLAEALSGWQMGDGHAEVLRESGGLVLVAVWMAVLTKVRPTKAPGTPR